MSFNDTTFKYEDAKKYIENLNTCNSDNDCPENSPCIGNKCIVTFNCKKEDKSICSLHDGICYTESETDRTCEKDDDCFYSICGKNGFCIEKQYNCVKYTIGQFTYENVKNYYEKLDIPCNITSNTCPLHTSCDDSYAYGQSKCKSKFYCNENKSQCSFSHVIKDGMSVYDYECNNDDECISNYCKDNRCKKVYLFEISKERNRSGLEDGNKCIKNEQCFTNHCSLDKGFKSVCREPSDSESVVIVYYIPFFLLILCAMIALLAYTSYRVKRYFNAKDAKANETKNEIEIELIDKN